VLFGQISLGKVDRQSGEYNLHHRDGAMPLKTTALSTEPVLVQQHELSIPMEMQPSAEKGVLSATILTYGATLTHLTCPDRLGQFQDVVLGFDHWRNYVPGSGEVGGIEPLHWRDHRTDSQSVSCMTGALTNHILDLWRNREHRVYSTVRVHVPFILMLEYQDRTCIV
jgi:hypothetical protein